MARKRHGTDYKGVFYREVPRVGGTGTERMYYAVFTKAGKVIEAKCGRQYADGMTAARANAIRGEYISGKRPLPKQERERRKAETQAETDRWTIAKLWKEYKAHNPGLKGLTTDENRFTKHLEDDLGGKEPRELLPLDIERLKRKLEGVKVKRHGGGTLSPATVRNVLELLRRIVNFGVRKHLCEPMPFKIGSKKAGASVAMPEVDNLKTEDLEPAQLKALLAAMDASPDLQTANFMRLALYTGMRRGELFKLTWEDIDFARGFILLRDPKGKKSQTIPLNDAARVVLENHPKPFKKSPYVFPGRKGKLRADINKAVRTITDAAGLPKDFRPLHGLRHAFASMLASSGQVDLYTLQKLLTHKSPTMTQRYAHLRDDTLRKASALAGALVAEVASADEEPAKADG